MNWLENFLKPLSYTFPSTNDTLSEDENHVTIPSSSEEEESPIVEDDSHLFRPTSFIEYCGQTKAKTILERYVAVSKEKDRVLPHLLIYGNAGCGKTTLARLLATERGTTFTEVIGSALKDPYYLFNLIQQINGGILFIDECHGLSRKTAEWLYTIMEDFTFQGEKLIPFTLIGATTEYGEMLKTRKPFCDRFKIIIELENYTTTEMEDIICQYWHNTFPSVRINYDVAKVLAENARLTPRIGIRLLDATIYFDGDYNTVLKNYNIVKDGFTTKDLKVLNYLAINQAGIDSICGYLNTSRNNFAYEIEPYLLQSGVIMRVSTGRKITDKGKKLLASVAGAKSVI